MPRAHELVSRSRGEFGWPRVVPVLERPALPPLKTGVRVFCRKPEPVICKQDDYQDYDKQLDCCKPAKFDHEDDDDDSVLMSRKKFQLLDESFTCRPVCADKTKLKTTFMVGYVPDELTFDEIKNRLIEPIDENAIKQCQLNKKFNDPFPFKRINDWEPIIG